MSISPTNWSSSTDPFVLALAHAYSGTLGDLSNNRIRLNDSEGFLNAVVADKDVQELFWSNDSDKEDTWPVNAFGKDTSGPASGYREFGGFKDNLGVGFLTFQPEDLIPADTANAYVYTTGKSAGAVEYSLFAYTGFAWEQKDPAQIIFSWVAHHVQSIWTLKDYLDQTVFQAASDYYDENPCGLSLVREVGKTIADQIKKVMDHTADFLVIAPQDITGDVLMSIKPRLSGLTTRTTPIDLESRSIKSYTIRPTDHYTIDRLNVDFGSVVAVSVAERDNPGGYDTTPHVEFPSETRNRVSQKVGAVEDDRNVTIQCPYHITRGQVLGHLDIGYWKDGQDEIELEFADLTHLNFEAGDVVPVTGVNYDGTEKFLVVEKMVDNDSLTATCRLLMLIGVQGKPARYADFTNLILNLRPNSTGLFFDGDASFPRTVPITDDPRNYDRLWDEAGYAHATEHTRGTVGGGPGPPELWPLEANKRERWPAFELATDTGLEISYSLTEGRNSLVTGTSSFTFYWVGNPTSVAGVRTLFQAEDTGLKLSFNHSGGGTTGKVQFYDGAWKGTADATTGWQILVFKCSVISGQSVIRRNGADIETGLTFSVMALSTAYDYGLGVDADGDSGVFQGDWGECALFKFAHSQATIDQIEAHLANKYGITI